MNLSFFMTDQNQLQNYSTNHTQSIPGFFQQRYQDPLILLLYTRQCFNQPWMLKASTDIHAVRDWMTLPCTYITHLLDKNQKKTMMSTYCLKLGEVSVVHNARRIRSREKAFI